MGRKHHDRACRRLVQLINKNRALVTQTVNHKLVMDNFVTHIDRGPVQLQRPLHNIDRAVNPCAKTARFGQNHFAVLSHYRTPSNLTAIRKRAPAGGGLKSKRAVALSRSRKMPEYRPPFGAVNSTISPGSNCASGPASRSSIWRVTRFNNCGLRWQS